jgi:hypothetical protein
MRGGVAVRHFGGFSRAIPQGGGLVGRISGWRPPPEPVGKSAQIRATGLAQEVLDVRAPVRVRIAPARCLTGWTRDGWDCPGGLGFGRVAVGKWRVFDLTRGATWQECARLAGLVARSGRSGRRGARGWRSAPSRRRPRQAGGEADPRQAGGEAEPGRQEVEQTPGRQEVRQAPGRQTCAFGPASDGTASQPPPDASRDHPTRSQRPPARKNGLRTREIRHPARGQPRQPPPEPP